MLGNPSHIGHTGEIYAVNSEGYLLSPAKYISGSDKGILSQNIRENPDFIKCITEKIDVIKLGSKHPAHYPNSTHNHDLITKYIDYRGELVYADHKYLPELNICLMSKFDFKEVESFLNKPIFNMTNISILIFSLVTMFLLGFKMDKNQTSNKIRKFIQK